MQWWLAGPAAVDRCWRAGQNAALDTDHGQRRRLQRGVAGGGRVADGGATVATVHGFAQGGVHAHLGGHAAQDQLTDVATDEHIFQASPVERTITRLVDHDFTGLRLQLVNEVMAVFTAHQQAPHGADTANGGAGPHTASHFLRRAVRQIR